MTQNLKFLISVSLVFITAGAFGQFNYKKGYVISAENDTLFGLIRDAGGSRNSEICYFKTDKKSKVVKYRPEDIKAYRFIGDKYYYSHALFFKNEYRHVFMDVLLEGSVNLYYYWRNKETAYYIEKDKGNVIGLINRELPEAQYSGSLYNVLNKVAYVEVYKDSLYSVFKESTEVQNRIDEVEYNHKAIIAITKDYISETCSIGNCISYVKELSVLKESLGVFSGLHVSRINFWDKDIKSGILLSMPVGISYNFPLPRINDRVSFQIELISNNFDYNKSEIDMPLPEEEIHIKANTIGIPLLFKYKLPMNKITPSLALGKETIFVFNSSVAKGSTDSWMLHQTQKGGWFFELGMNYKFAPKYSLFSNLRLQTFSNIVMPDENNNNRLPFSTHLKNHPNSIYNTSMASLYFGISF